VIEQLFKVNRPNISLSVQVNCYLPSTIATSFFPHATCPYSSTVKTLERRVESGEGKKKKKKKCVEGAIYG